MNINKNDIVCLTQQFLCNCIVSRVSRHVNQNDIGYVLMRQKHLIIVYLFDSKITTVFHHDNLIKLFS